MIDDKDFSLGEILWEYSDFSPEDDITRPVSSPSPLQPSKKVEGVLTSEEIEPQQVSKTKPVIDPASVPPANRIPVAKTKEQQPQEKGDLKQESGEEEQVNSSQPVAQAEQTKESKDTAGESQNKNESLDDDLIFATAFQKPRKEEQLPSEKEPIVPHPRQAKQEDNAQKDDRTQAAQVKEKEQVEVHLKTERKPKAEQKAPPDIEPGRLADIYYGGLGNARVRSVCSAVCSGLLLVLALSDTGYITYLQELITGTVNHFMSFGLFLFVALLCKDVIKSGIIQLTNRMPDADTLAMFATIFTAVDGVTTLLIGMRPQTLALFAPCAIVLAFHQIGHTCGRAAKAISCDTAAAMGRAYLVTQDTNVIGKQSALRKWHGEPKGFGSQTLSQSGPSKQFQKLTPVLLVSCFLISLVTTVLHGQPTLVFWSLSALFIVASTLGAALSFELPFRMVASKLKKIGAALAGWPGVEASKGGGSILLGDYDLYPPGAVTLSKFQTLGGADEETAVSLAASAIRASGSGLGTLFDHMIRKVKGKYIPIKKVEFSENGFLAFTEDGAKILVGDNQFMSKNAVPLPQSAITKDTIFCAKNMQPVGMFSLQYNLHPSVAPCIEELSYNKVQPVMVTRDFNVRPSRLRISGHIKLEAENYPDLNRRVSLSTPAKASSGTRIAYVTREGILSFSKAVVSAKRVRKASNISSVFVQASAIVGVFLTATLSSSGALKALSAWNLALFLLLWFVPVALFSIWAYRS